MSKNVFVVGHYHSNDKDEWSSWSVEGIFDEFTDAYKICLNESDFIAVFEMNVHYDEHEFMDIEDSFYPSQHTGIPDVFAEKWL